MHLRTIVNEQKAFSETAFGPGPRTKGVLDHIRKEIREVEEDPSALEEWVDIMILAADGAWRAGYSGAAIERAYIDKVRRNKTRQWPDWRTADPDKAIEHIR